MTKKASIDYSKLNDSIVELDSTIFSSSIVTTRGEMLAHSVRRGYETKFSFDEKARRNWGAWISVMVGVARQSDKFLTEMQYVSIGRKEFKGLIIPFDKFGLIIRVTLEKNSEATRIYELVNKHVMQSAGSV